MIAELAVGVDFGATNIKAGVCTREGRMLSLVRGPTNVEVGIDAVVRRIVELVERAILESDVDPLCVSGVGVGACGLVNRERGLLICSSVLPGWRDVPLVQLLAEATRRQVYLANDANSAILGEWFTGVATGLTDVIGMTLGTGIGGAAILKGMLYEGASGLAGELGHLTVDPDGPRCNCGNRGCVGLLAGGQGIVQRYQQRVSARGVECERDIDARRIFAIAEQGDALCREVVAETARYIGIAIGNVLSCFNPEMVVLTGGITQAGESFLSAIRKEASQRTYSPIFEFAKIVFGRFGDAAGVSGAAGIIFHPPAGSLQ